MAKAPKPIMQCVEFPQIVKHPAMQFGDATVKGTRKTAKIMGMYAAGDGIEHTMHVFELSRTQVKQCLAYLNCDKRKLHWKKIGETTSYL